jgi:hypothetical protein
MMRKTVPNGSSRDKDGPTGRTHGSRMKFVEPSPFIDPDAAARKLVEIANAIEPVQDGWLWLHESGTFVKSTDAERRCSPNLHRKP